jgi:hypothetical protein
MVRLVYLSFIFLVSFPAAFAAPGDLCFEDPDDLCGLTSGDPELVFTSVLQPLETQVPGFAMVIFWGGMLAIVWFKTENIMILAIVGIFVNATISGLSETAQGIGLLLLGVANGILLFQLVRQRVSLFS